MLLHSIYSEQIYTMNLEANTTQHTMSMSTTKTKPPSKKKCMGKDRHMRPCRYCVEGETHFCKNHQYMKNYTSEQMSNLILCSGCKKVFYTEAHKLCDKCLERGKTVREQNRPTEKCAVEKCQYKPSEQNKYCNVHQIHVWIDEVHDSGHTPCTQYIRGCRNIIHMTSKYKRCEECRELERKKDQVKRNKAKQQNETATNPNTKCCTTCCKTHPIEFFMGEKGKETVTCKYCRESDKLQNTRRDKEHRREQNRKYEESELRKKQKKEWKSSNWDKVVNAWKNYRKKKRETDLVGFLAKNAENAKQWRNKNPDAVQLQYERTKNTLECQYKIYVQSAKHRNIDFNVSFEDYKSIVENHCYYCGVLNEKRGFQGMDRIDSSQGYFAANCVACCPMCNYIKGRLTQTYFFERIEHILTHCGKISGSQYPDSFKNYLCVSYSSYKQRANKNNWSFTLTQENYNHITNQPCYLCGKPNTPQHKNGIDRVDSSIGYVMENCKPCCGGCNYMKNNFNIETWMSQLMRIQSQHKHQNHP